MHSIQKLLNTGQLFIGRQCNRVGNVHRSLLVSISPNKSLLPPLLEVPAEVAEAADEVVENATEGLLARIDAECLSCLQLIII